MCPAELLNGKEYNQKKKPQKNMEGETIS